MRLERDEYFLQMAELAARRSTCLRRSVGCILTDAKGHVLATGYNGVPAGVPHCNEPFGVFACPGARSESGKDLAGCRAVHAEQNALLQCPDVDRIHTCYCTASPCLFCVRMLMNTGCLRVVFREEYPHPGAKDEWLSGGRVANGWVHL